LGRGTLKIIDECKKANLSEPVIEEVTGGISVTIQKNESNANLPKQHYLNKRQIKAIEFLKENGQMTNMDYQKRFKVSRETATNDLSDLVKKGIIKSSGVKGAGSFFTLI
jgi:ATP-dependent DNA helicase RecG